MRQVTKATLSPTGDLSFRYLNSSVDNNPGANYTYSNVFDVDLSFGYNDVEESFVNNRIKRSFTGDLRGNFICSIMVSTADLGSTGEKLNQLPKVRTTGEKGIIEFRYRDKTQDASTVEHVFSCEVDRVQLLYRTNEGVVYRLIARLTSDVVMTVV